MLGRPGGARPLGTSLAVAGAVTAAVAAALTWVHSGQATRSGYGLVRSATVLGLTDDWRVRALTVGIAALPALAAGAWLAAALRRRGAVATLGASSGLISLIAAAAIWAAPVRAGVGPVVATTAAVASLGGAVLLAAAGRRP